MGWMISEEKLGVDQREVIDELSKNWKTTWIKGHAGSGKSVLLIHALREYLTKHPKSRVCVVVFTRSLEDMINQGMDELNLQTRYNTFIPVFTIYEFQKKSTNYDAVFCDEVQDLPVDFLAELKSRANVLIVAGDEEQSIYSLVPRFNTPPAKPSELNKTLQPEVRPLTYIYRMTKSVVKMLCRVFTSMRSGRPNVEKNDVEIKLAKAYETKEEIKYVWSEAKRINNNRPDESIAFLLPSKNLIYEFANAVLEIENSPNWDKEVNRFDDFNFGALNNHFDRNNVPLLFIGQGYGSLKKANIRNKIIIMTYHSSKGLDFDHVFLPLLGSDFFLPDDKAETLFFVALSRSKYNLMISYTGVLDPKIKKFMDGEQEFLIEEQSRPTRVII